MVGTATAMAAPAPAVGAAAVAVGAVAEAAGSVDAVGRRRVATPIAAAFSP